MADIEIGVIGGSGLYEMEQLVVREERRIETPWGDPSDAYILGEIDGRGVAFLPRHARGHRLLPSELNFRANIYGMKVLGVEWIISISAVGSLKEEYAPKDIVVPDQFYDRTRHRPDTFFGNGLVGHVGFADPVCSEISAAMADGAQAAGARVHRGGTYVCMEGPQFSTRAESEENRSRGFDVVGMTNLQEAKLAREAEISYGTLAMVTDYDCWHEEEDDVSVEGVLDVLRANVETAKEAIRRSIELIPAGKPSPYKGSLRYALMTAPAEVPRETLQALAPIVGPYMSAE